MREDERKWGGRELQVLRVFATRGEEEESA